MDKLIRDFKNWSGKDLTKIQKSCSSLTRQKRLAYAVEQLYQQFKKILPVAYDV